VFESKAAAISLLSSFESAMGIVAWARRYRIQIWLGGDGAYIVGVTATLRLC